MHVNALKDLVGLHTLGGACEVRIGVRWHEAVVLLAQIDDEVYAFFERSSQVGIARLRDQGFPFEHKDVCRIAFEILDGRHAPVVCNFIWRPQGINGVLYAIDEVRNLVVLKVGFEQITYAGKTPILNGQRTVLSLSSGENVLPGMTARITARPNAYAVIPQRLLIGGNPEDWFVNDLIIGNRSQFAQGGGMPGSFFSPQAVVPVAIRFEILKMSMDFEIDVRYVGTDPLGSPFFAAVVGNAIVPDRCFLTHWAPEGLWESWMAVDETDEDALPAPRH